MPTLNDLLSLYNSLNSKLHDAQFSVAKLDEYDNNFKAIKAVETLICLQNQNIQLESIAEKPAAIKVNHYNIAMHNHIKNFLGEPSDNRM